MPTKASRRKDNNFFTTLTVSTDSFDVLAQWNFNSVGLALAVYSNDPTDIIEYSFDGKSVHGDMRPTFPSEAIIFDNRYVNKVWFRRRTAGTAVEVRVESWRFDA